MGKTLWGWPIGHSPRGGRPVTAFDYLTAMVLVGLALFISVELWSILQPTPSPVFVTAIILCSWYWGMGPGLLASLLSTLLIDYYFKVPFYELNPTRDELVRFVAFSVVTVLVSRVETSRRKDKATIRAQNAYTELLLEAAVALNQATPVDALQACVDKICLLAGWSVGYAYLLSDDGLKLDQSECWYLSDKDRFTTFVRATQAQKISDKHTLTESVTNSGRPVWINDIKTNELFERRAQASEAGLTTGLACPVLMGSEVVGVMEFFSVDARQPDPKLIAVISLVGIQLARVVKNEAEQWS